MIYDFFLFCNMLIFSLLWCSTNTAKGTHFKILLPNISPAVESTFMLMLY